MGEDVLHILVVDDDPDDRALAVHELRREFRPVALTEVADAEGFARALSAGGFDAVVTDYQLGWSTGLEILRAVKGQYPDCPVIMFTGTGSEEVAVEAMKSGLSDYVSKSPRHDTRLSVAARGAIE